MSDHRPDQPADVLVVDGANVVGSRPDGWWKDREGAARRLHEQLYAAPLAVDVVVLVLEGRARGGVPEGLYGPSASGALHRVVHAPGEGDPEIARQAALAVQGGSSVVVVTADRALAEQVAPAQVQGPGWLRARL